MTSWPKPDGKVLSDSLELGEMVEWMQVTPDQCYICGYRQGNGTEAYPDNYGFVLDCWDLQIPPYPELDLDKAYEN